ncbi:MAG: L,D-transpeptidase family protein [Nitriliruptorales bacterium]|nr:L,D-transpeptidase family protein [Nitriliruptorales bacterium]
MSIAAAKHGDPRLRRVGLPAALLALLILAGACSPPSEPAHAVPPADTPDTGTPGERSTQAETLAPPSPADRGEPLESREPASDTEPPAPGDDATEGGAPAAGIEPEPPAPAVEAGLARGAEGEPVRLLQRRLTDLGYKPLGIDGVFGPGTQRSVEVFQHDHGLPVTGTVGAAMVQALQTATPVAPLGPGATGPEVAEVQQLLNDGPFDAGPVDGQYGTMTQFAVYALQRLHGYPADGVVTPLERRLLATDAAVPPRVGGTSGTHVEIDLGRQLTSVFRDGRLLLAVHSSSGNNETFCTPAGGCRRAVTPTGDYTISRRIAGWRTSELGRLYNPLYFNGGIALHGAHSVPTHPASHGCVRVPMWIAEYLPDLLPNGTPVHVR